MEYLVSAQEMKNCDNRIIQHYGVPSLVLMERAALKCTELLFEKKFDLTSVLVVAGSGNNGGDGFAIARLLYLKKIPVSLWFIGNPEHMTEEASLQKKICENYGITFVRNLEDGEYTTIVDAIFGSGLAREVSGVYREVIEKINAYPAKVLAVDIPSGIRSDDGGVAGTAIRADVTGALAFCKVGHVLFPGADYAGEVVRLDIGITEEGFDGKVPEVSVIDAEALSWLPKRKADSNKGTFGKAGILAGSKNMAGAAYLSGKAAYLTGTGLVRVLSDECNRTILQTLLPEAVLSTMEEFQKMTVWETVTWADAVGIGPGLSTSENAEKILWTVLSEETKPKVLDADALNLAADHLDWIKRRKDSLILTPHMGEMARLLRMSVEEIKADRLNLARQFAEYYRVILVLKDSRTIVTNGKQIYVNETGNQGMATGGSGDVLTGIITGLLAQKMDPFQAAVLGVYLHGCSGDEAYRKKGYRGMLSSDLLEALPDVLKEGQNKNEEKL